MTQKVRIVFLFISLFFAAKIYHTYLTTGIGFITVYLDAPCFFISSLIAVFISTNSKIRFIHKRFSSLFIWTISIFGIVFTLTVFNKILNISPIVFSTKFYWEEGIDIEFRKNKTFKAINIDFFYNDLSYGKYELTDSFIYLKNKLKFGIGYLSDTLLITKNGILFTMDQPWRINEGSLDYNYQQRTLVEFQNNSQSIVDSISITLPYNWQIAKTISLHPDQKINYKFKLSNPNVDGKYILSFKLMTQLEEVKTIKNFLKGYPLEMVESIRFEKDKIQINLIIGKEIIVPYNK